MKMEIGIRRHRVRTFVGVEGYEKKRPQDLLFDISACYDASEAVVQDEIEYAVNYVGLIDLVDEVAASGHYHLIETIVAQLASKILERFPQIEWVRVRVEKQAALPTAEFSYAAVEMSR